MKRTIVYAFGPKRLAQDYYNNKEMILEDKGGWLKIGQTSETDDCVNKWDSAIKRCRQIPHTGINETSTLYDVFEFPHTADKIDDRIRGILTDDMYSLENSRSGNKNIDKYDIKAGEEFVYGATRNMLRNAIAKFEKDLLIAMHGKYNTKQYGELVEMIRQNDSDDEQECDDAAKQEDSDNWYEWCDAIFASVIKKITPALQEKGLHPVHQKNKNYLYVPSAVWKSEKVNYACSINSRCGGLMNTCIETFAKETGRNKIDEYIANNSLSDKIGEMTCERGKKCGDKWSWRITNSLNKSDNEIITWLTNGILSFYNAFEKPGACIQQTSETDNGQSDAL